MKRFAALLLCACTATAQVIPNPATFPAIVVGGATGGSQGAGTINATGIYINGVAIGTGSSTAFYVSPYGSDSNPGTLAQPFLTLAKAQTAMQGSTYTKTTYLRGGTYSLTTPLALVTADSGETWSYYAPDGYDAPILDGGSSSSTTGYNLITIDGATGITINGLTMQNFEVFAVGLHGGPAESGVFFPNSTSAANNTTIENCIIQNGYAAPQGAFPIDAIFQIGTVTNTTIANNAILNQYGAGITIIDKSAATNQGQNYAGLLIKNNAILYTNTQQGDSGAIYLVNRFQNSSPSIITNNFIRDYQGVASTGTTSTPRDIAFYLDDGSQGVTITGNVVGNTGHVVNSYLGTNSGTSILWTNGGNNITFSGNIADLSTSPQIVDAVYAPADFSSKSMSGNVVTGNIFIGKWSGSQETWGAGIGPHAYPESVGIVVPTISNNLYYNYGSGSLDTTGNLTNGSDVSPITSTNPNLSGATYTGSTFVTIQGGWGPPGYTLPSGTTPSYSQ
nr:hypothetical protein [uncultured Rhodopila sp.]